MQSSRAGPSRDFLVTLASRLPVGKADCRASVAHQVRPDHTRHFIVGVVSATLVDGVGSIQEIRSHSTVNHLRPTDAAFSALFIRAERSRLLGQTRVDSIRKSGNG